jgi:5'-nucleotidase
LRILVSNDDGIHREGLQALVEAVEPLGEVWVVAPAAEMSGVSHAITLDRPLRVHRYKGRERWLAVGGTPTDCVYLAVHHFMKDHPPDLVVSGINHGSNLGTDVHYSGTVAAAHEAMNNGIPAIAFSLVAYGDYEFAAATTFARKIVTWVIENGLPKGVMLNCNVPKNSDGRFALCSQGRRTYGGTRVVHRQDPRGGDYYWIGGTEVVHSGRECSDTAAHDDGLISVMPIQQDLTAFNALASLSKMRLDGRAPERFAEGLGA